jgi:hypothetical protein
MAIFWVFIGFCAGFFLAALICGFIYASVHGRNGFYEP